jgi:hypothetical protein
MMSGDQQMKKTEADRDRAMVAASLTFLKKVEEVLEKVSQLTKWMYALLENLWK